MKSFLCLALAGLAGGLLGSVLAASELKTDERVVFFPTLAHQVEGGWEAEIHGQVFEPERRRLATSALRKVLGLDDDDMSAGEKAIWRERSQYFVADNERGKQITVRIGGQECVLPDSAPNGHFHGRLHLSEAELQAGGVSTNGVVRYTLAGRDARLADAGMVHLVGRVGVSVISDIDDTIKVSDVRNRKELVRNTFVRPFQAVPGLARIYAEWARNRGAQFHYVSASPWQLYRPLAEFVRSNGFPAGTFHLKHFRIKDETLLELFASPELYKPSVIVPLLEQFPERQFVLVGDSGEKDPEIYAAVARQFPKQVLRIYIRDVTGEAPDAARYRRVFAELPAARWQVFREPSELKGEWLRE